MGTVCKLCSYTYCQRHSLPEVHGCGQAARAAARATLTAPRQLRDKERAELKGELKKKVGSLSGGSGTSTDDAADGDLTESEEEACSKEEEERKEEMNVLLCVCNMRRSGCIPVSWGRKAAIH